MQTNTSPPTTRQMLALWLPLAASVVMMVLEPTIINIGLGRTATPELALAAYGVAFSLALLVEAPIIMLLDASVARAVDRPSFVLIRRFAFLLGLAVTVIGLILSFTPLYDLVVRGWMHIPADVATQARPTLRVLSFWSFPIAWRRAHQGVLIRARHTAAISAATVVRLLTLAGAMLGGLVLYPEQGALVAGIAMVISVNVEALLITLATRPTLRSPAYRLTDPTAGHPPPTMRSLWRFYRPLLWTTILRQFGRPLLNAGIAAAAMPVASLAAWPVTWGFAILIAGPAWSLQQLSTALVSDAAAYRAVKRFALSLGAVMALLLGAVAFTPLYGPVMGDVYNLSPALQELARPALQLLVLYPLLMGAQSLLRGVLIRTGRTDPVRWAMAINISTLGATLLVGVALFTINGVVLAAIATLTGGLAELAFLWWKRESIADGKAALTTP